MGKFWREIWISLSCGEFCQHFSPCYVGSILGLLSVRYRTVCIFQLWGLFLKRTNYILNCNQFIEEGSSHMVKECDCWPLKELLGVELLLTGSEGSYFCSCQIKNGLSWWYAWIILVSRWCDFGNPYMFSDQCSCSLLFPHSMMFCGGACGSLWLICVQVWTACC